MTQSFFALGLAALSLAGLACSDDSATTSTEGAGGATSASSTTTTASTTSATTTTASSAGGGGAGATTTGTGGEGGATASASSTTTTSTGTTPQCATPTPDACGTCVFDKCNARFCECAAEPACAPIQTCLGACTANDDACIFDCFAQQPTGVAEAGLLSDCVAEACGAQGGDCAKAQPLDACAECTLASCEAEFESCNADAACNALVECASQCASGDNACATACALQNTSGIGKAQTVQSCLQDKCAGAC